MVNLKMNWGGGMNRIGNVLMQGLTPWIRFARITPVRVMSNVRPRWFLSSTLPAGSRIPALTRDGRVSGSGEGAVRMGMKMNRDKEVQMKNGRQPARFFGFANSRVWGVAA